MEKVYHTVKGYVKRGGREMVEFSNDWDGLLADELQKPYFQNILAFLNQEYRRAQCYPPPQQVFRALRATPYEKVRAVILGQDPYHGPGQAHGLCFSVNAGVPLPPSLENIFAELHADLGCPAPQSGDLSGWAERGVLLLNTILSVRRGRPILILLWGAPARAKKSLLTNPAHLILEAPHPSPLSASRGFFGCRHFSKANAFLQAHGEAPIDWSL